MAVAAEGEESESGDENMNNGFNSESGDENLYALLSRNLFLLI